MWQIPAFVISLIGLIIATYTDLKERIVSNKLNFTLLAAGLSLHLIYSIFIFDALPILYSILALAYAFLFAYFLYKIGFWAGGDVKLFAAIAALNPLNPAIVRFFGLKLTIFSLPIFPLELFIVALFSMLPINIGIVFYKADDKIRKDLLLMLGIPLLLWIASFFLPKGIKDFLIALTLFGFVYFIFACYFVGKFVLVRKIKISELYEGMIPAEFIFIENGKVHREKKGFNIKSFINYLTYQKISCAREEIVNPFKARGVTKQEIKKLKELVKKNMLEDSILVKESLPMVPSFLFAYIILNFSGDILWLFLP